MQFIKNPDKSIVLMPESDEDYPFLEYLTYMIENCNHIEMSTPAIGGSNIQQVSAIGECLEQTQSEFCPHWTPPVLIKQ